MAPSGGEILVLLLLIPAHCFAQEILHAPESTTVFLNEPAVFTCETRGGDTLWLVNGTQRSTFLPDMRGDLVLSEEITTPEGNTVQTLTIPARPQYNGTRVQCASVIFRGPVVESENATLTIQGPLSTVGDLKAISKNASSVTISWSAPFSLDVTGVHPDIWYSVLIYNVTDENNPTAIFCTDCINITETHYTFTPDYLSPCHVYNFSVIPLNGVGQGESSGNVTSNGIQFPRVSVQAKDDDVDYRDVTFNITQLEDVITIFVHGADSHPETKTTTNGTVVFTLRADHTFSASTETTCQKEISNTFTTFDIQQPRVESTDGCERIQVAGEFIKGSRAKGTFLAIQPNSSTEAIFFALKRNGTNRYLSETISPPPSTYTVYVHDLEENGLPNPLPANPKPYLVAVKRTYAEIERVEVENASISQHGSTVTVDCVPQEKGTSCLVMYKALSNPTLSTLDNKKFPLDIKLNPDKEENYTFALFRQKNSGDIDVRPFMTKSILVGKDGITSSSPTPTPSVFDPKLDEDSNVAVIVGVLVPAFIMTIISTVIVIRRKRQKKTNSTGDAEKGNLLRQGEDGRKDYSTVDGDKQTIPVDSSQEHVSVGQNVTEGSDRYATVVTSSPLPVDTSAGLDDIRATHRMAMSEYAEVVSLPAGRPKPLEMDTRATTPVNGPPTVESVMSLLEGVVGRWKMIAEGLEFNEDLIDEIDINNNANEGCLQHCVEIWVSKLQPSWEKLSHVLEELGEEELARKAWSEDGVPHHSGQGEPQPIQSCDGGQKTEDSSKGSSEVVLGGQLGIVPTDTNKTENEAAKMMSEELEQEARHSSTPQKDFEKGLDSGVVSGSADLSSMEVRSSLELSSVEVENGRDSDDDSTCVVEKVSQVPVDTEDNSPCVPHAITPGTQPTAQSAGDDRGEMVTGLEEKTTIPGERKTEDIRGPMLPNKQSRVEQHATPEVPPPFNALQEESVISDSDCDDELKTGVQETKHHSPPQNVSSTAKAKDGDQPGVGSLQPVETRADEKCPIEAPAWNTQTRYSWPQKLPSRPIPSQPPPETESQQQQEKSSCPPHPPIAPAPRLPPKKENCLVKIVSQGPDSLWDLRLRSLHRSFSV